MLLPLTLTGYRKMRLEFEVKLIVTSAIWHLSIGIAKFMFEPHFLSARTFLSHAISWVRNEYPLVFLHLLSFSNYYYFVFGWSGNLIPKADLSIIFNKYVFFSLVYGYFIFQFFYRLSFEKIEKNIVLIILGLSSWFLIDLFHLIDYQITDWLRLRIINITLFIGTIPLFIIVYKQIDIEELFDKCFKMMIFIGAINFLFGIYSYFLLPDRLFSDRAIGLSQNPITFSGIQYSCAVICLIKFLKYERSILYFLLYLMFSYGVIISGTVSCFIMLLLITIIILTIFQRGFMISRLFKRIVVFSFLIFLFKDYFVKIDIIDKMISIISKPFYFETFYNRYNAHFSVLRSINDFTWVEIIVGKISPAYKTFDSMYLSIFYNSGILGIIIFSSIFIYPTYAMRGEFYRLNKYYSELITLLLLIFSYFFFGLFHSVQYKFPMNLFVAIQISLLILYRIKKATEKNTKSI